MEGNIEHNQQTQPREVTAAMGQPQLSSALGAWLLLGETTVQAIATPQPGWGAGCCQGTPRVSPPQRLARSAAYPHPAHVAQLILVSHGVFQDLEE